MENYKVLSSDNQEIITDEVLHPGDVLEMELEERGIKKNFAAAKLGIHPSHLSDLLKQKRHVSAVIAIKLVSYLLLYLSFVLQVPIQNH